MPKVKFTLAVKHKNGDVELPAGALLISGECAKDVTPSLINEALQYGKVLVEVDSEKEKKGK